MIDALLLIFIASLFIGLFVIAFILSLPFRASIKGLLIGVFFILYQLVLDTVR